MDFAYPSNLISSRSPFMFYVPVILRGTVVVEIVAVIMVTIY